MYGFQSKLVYLFDQAIVFFQDRRLAYYKIWQYPINYLIVMFYIKGPNCTCDKTLFSLSPAVWQNELEYCPFFGLTREVLLKGRRVSTIDLVVLTILD
jgi:hypothetical protein